MPGSARPGRTPAATGAKISPVGAGGLGDQPVHPGVRHVDLDRLRPGPQRGAHVDPPRGRPRHPAVGAVHPHPGEISHVGPGRGPRRGRGARRRASSSVAYVPSPAKPAASGPSSVHGRGPSGSSASRTPGRVSRHGAVERHLGSRRPGRRLRGSAVHQEHRAERRELEAVAPTARLRQRLPAQRHRVPGDRRTARRRPQGHRHRRRQRVGQEDHLAGADAPADPQQLRALDGQGGGPRRPTGAPRRRRRVQRPGPVPQSASHSRACSPSSSASDGDPSGRRPTTAAPAATSSAIRRSARTVIRALEPPRYSSRYRPAPADQRRRRRRRTGPPGRRGSRSRSRTRPGPPVGLGPEQGGDRRLLADEHRDVDGGGALVEQPRAPGEVVDPRAGELGPRLGADERLPEEAAPARCPAAAPGSAGAATCGCRTGSRRARARGRRRA